MRVSGFTFLRNGTMLGYPFIESIQSVLPLCDEFVVNVGRGEDDTLERIRAIGSDKIRIIESEWSSCQKTRGYVYGQQKMIAQFNCTGDWAFYLEGDEVVHEDDLPKIREAMERHLHDDEVEALVFDFLHFYGNANTYAWSPAWYRRAPRIIKCSVRSYAPDGLFWLVLATNKGGRYPKAAQSGATIYHYGWVRPESRMNLKSLQVQRYWNKEHKPIDYSKIDSTILREFKGSHPQAVADWLEVSEGIFRADPAYRPTKKEKRHRLMLKLEAWLGLELSKKHFKLVR
ncbi:MAG: glycosyltransferase [Acidobacteriota bacterium]